MTLRRRSRFGWLFGPLVVVTVAAGCEAVAPIVEPASLTVIAENVEFTPKRVELPAGVPLRVTLRNADAAVPHGLRLQPMRSGVEAPVLLETEILTGPAERTFELPALEAGPYLFTCPIHPHMQIEAEAR